MSPSTMLWSLIAVNGVTTHAYDWFNASTTRFHIADFKKQTGSCGGCGLDLFSGVEGWAAVSAAEAMQIPYACDGAYQCGTGTNQTSAGGVSGGCGQCYSVRSQNYNPYGAETPEVHFYAAVVDSCAHEYNTDWCPKHVGAKNSFGFQYHLNVLDADADKLKLGDNSVVHFRPIDCPDDIVEVLQTSCCDKWFKGIGCSTICPDNSCTAPSPVPSPSPSPVACDPVCDDPRSCVAQADGYWAQCIDCGAEVFQKECIFWGAALREAAEDFCGSTCGASFASSQIVVTNGCREPPTPYRGNLLVMDGCHVVANLSQGLNVTVVATSTKTRFDLVYERQVDSRNSCDELCVDCYYVQVGVSTVTIGYGDDIQMPSTPWTAKAPDGITINWKNFCGVYGGECPSTVDMSTDDVVSTFCADSQIV